MPILTLSPISASPVPLWTSPASHSGPFWQRSSPSSDRSILSAWASLSRASGEVAQALDASILPHDRHAFDRLQRPNEHAGAGSGRLARHIEHEREAVSEINIRMSALEEQRAIARRHAPIGVPGGVADDIGLRLDNAAACRAFGQFPHQELADEKAGERGGVDRQRRPGERLRPCLWRPGFTSAQPDARATAPARTDRRNIASRA